MRIVRSCAMCKAQCAITKAILGLFQEFFFFSIQKSLEHVLGRCGACPASGVGAYRGVEMRIFVVSCVIAVGHVPVETCRGTFLLICLCFAS